MKFVAKCVQDGFTLVSYILKQKCFCRILCTVEGGVFKWKGQCQAHLCGLWI